jgi:hypothetical protein
LPFAALVLASFSGREELGTSLAADFSSDDAPLNASGRHALHLICLPLLHPIVAGDN